MVKEWFRPSVGFPTNRQEAVAYAEEMTGGIKLWEKIDAVVMPLVILLWFFNFAPLLVVVIAAVFAIGCPIIMILGYSVGWLGYLTPKECYGIVKTKHSS